ncbi:unnamed protein product [Thelazia callipaeda]|uniref:Uncharacterized protein n=1 Tax=Thelazia callipaeda TaxID=103827 RepID=A0A0N5CTJ5_THECL|nr:unnamed protein product [Thelazia callipaeda]
MQTNDVLKLVNDLFRKSVSLPKKYWNLWSQLRKQPKLEIDQSRLVGDFHNHGDRGDWRVIGMRSTRTNNVSIEYDVMLRSFWAALYLNFAQLQMMTKENNDQVMKFCTSDNSKDHLFFMQQYKLLEVLKRRYPNYR